MPPSVRGQLRLGRAHVHRAEGRVRARDARDALPGLPPHRRGGARHRTGRDLEIGMGMI